MQASSVPSQRRSQREVVFIWHQNLNASLLPRDKIVTYATKWTRAMFDSALVPFNISSMGEDWAVIQRLDPKLVADVVRNPNVCVLNGTFSHSFFSGLNPALHLADRLPSRDLGAFSELIKDLQDQQLSLGDLIHRGIFGQKVSPVGFIPEFDLSSLEVGLIRKYWPMSVVREGINLLHPIDAAKFDPTHDLAHVRQSVGDDSLPCLVAADKLRWHSLLQGMYVGEVKPEDLVREIKNEANRPLANPIVFVYDMDSVFLNRLNDEPENDPAFGVWLKFQYALKMSGLDIKALSPEGISSHQDGAEKEQSLCIAPPRNYKRWGIPWLDYWNETFSGALKIDATNYARLLALSLAATDYLSVLVKKPKSRFSLLEASPKMLSFSPSDTLRYEYVIKRIALSKGCRIGNILDAFSQYMRLPPEQLQYLHAVDEVLWELAGK